MSRVTKHPYNCVINLLRLEDRRRIRREVKFTEFYNKLVFDLHKNLWIDEEDNETMWKGNYMFHTIIYIYPKSCRYTMPISRVMGLKKFPVLYDIKVYSYGERREMTRKFIEDYMWLNFGLVRK
jgi:hypothetical protein